jgi:hypothetical protein
MTKSNFHPGDKVADSRGINLNVTQGSLEKRDENSI